MNSKRLGTFWTTRIGTKKIVVFKSDSHLSQDVKVAPKAGETLPNEDVWRQIIDDVDPGLVITTGTAGGIGTSCEVGDVVVSRIVRFDCQKWLTKEPFAHVSFKGTAPNTRLFTTARKLFKANSGNCPRTTHGHRRSSWVVLMRCPL